MEDRKEQIDQFDEEIAYLFISGISAEMREKIASKLDGRFSSLKKITWDICEVLGKE